MNLVDVMDVTDVMDVMVGWMDGWMHGQINVWIDGRMDGRTEGRWVMYVSYADMFPCICACIHLALQIWVRGMTGCCNLKMASQLWDGRTTCRTW